MGSVSYLGIEYTVDANNVWVPNPHTTIVNENLTMGEDNTLKNLHHGGNPIILNTNTAPRSFARLENYRNFKVTEMNVDGNSMRILWQSFDYSTNTPLPSMKLGMEFNTKRK